jgi:predicted ester cyclase
MSEHPTQLISRLVHRVWNEGATEELEDFFSDPFEHNGREDRIASLREWHRRHSETWAAVRYQLSQEVSDGVSVAVRWQAVGRQVGPWGPVPPSGQVVTWFGAHFFTVSAGRITGMWAMTDTFGIARQLGVRFEPPADLGTDHRDPE